MRTVAPQGAVLVSLICSAMLLSRGRSSLGKAIMGLQITGLSCAMRREFRRLGPLLAINSGTLLMPHEVLITLLGTSLYRLVILSAGVALVMGWYYLWPLMRWRDALGPCNRV